MFKKNLNTILGGGRYDIRKISVKRDFQIIPQHKANLAGHHLSFLRRTCGELRCNVNSGILRCKANSCVSPTQLDANLCRCQLSAVPQLRSKPNSVGRRFLSGVPVANSGVKHCQANSGGRPTQKNANSGVEPTKV
jgi:hypothetical protein